MPNHCSNVTRIYGPKTEVKDLYGKMFAKGIDGELQFKIANLMPCPQELTETPARSTDIPASWNSWVENGEWTPEEYQVALEELLEVKKKQESNLEKYGCKDWYDWSIENWGNKWGDYDHYYLPTEVSEYDDQGELLIRYQTAWGPFSEEFWGQISEQFPNCLFVTGFEESGMDFIGAVSAKNGYTYLIDDSFGIYLENDVTDDDWEQYLESVNEKLEVMIANAEEGLMNYLNNGESNE
jgi:hypothetical protein